MSHFPITLDLDNSNVLIIGKGHLAIAKIRLCLAAGAKITALIYDDKKIETEFDGQIKIVKGSFDQSHLVNKRLVYISGVSDKELKKIITAAKKHNIPYNHVDDPENSNFSTPAMMQRGPITVAISTGGKAPVLSRNIRKKLEQILPREIGNLVDLLHEYRPGVNKLMERGADKLAFWNKVYSDSEINHLLKLNDNERRKRIFKLIGTSSNQKKSGHVQIVGAGPGDPELLTLKAHRALLEADVIIYDNLISKEILNLSRRDAELIYVGKKRSSHSKTQNEINQIVIDHANKGLLVVRLKGGDPTIFGRVAEEIDALRNNDISFEIIPGITAASGIAASTSIPLTHRDHASMITLATGHRKKGEIQNWQGLAGPGRTIAIYMGISTADETAKSLIRDGFSADTPVAIIENGTCLHERRIYGTLCDLGNLVLAYKVVSPALLIVGDVVSESPEFTFPENILKIAN